MKALAGIGIACWWICILVCSGGAQACPLPGFTPEAYLVRDINQGLVLRSSEPRFGRVLGDGFLFVAYDREHGWALWRTDGSEGGTVLLMAGLDSEGEPYLGTPISRNRQFLRAGGQLWITDGTAEGAVLLSDADLGPFFASPCTNRVYCDSLAASVGNVLVFQGYDSSHGHELWRSDGTLEGTAFVRALAPGRGLVGLGYIIGSEPNAFSPLRDRAIFQAYSGANEGNQVWMTDGTRAGLVLLKDKLVLSSFLGQTVAPIGGQFIFGAQLQEAGHGYEPWLTDGTPQGTRRLRDIVPGPEWSDAFRFTPLGSNVFFIGRETGSNLSELFVTDGTESGTRRVTDKAHFDYGCSFSLAAVGDRLFFTGLDPDHGCELWVTDGTEEGTRLVKDIAPGTAAGFAPANSVDTLFAGFGDRLLFFANDGEHGPEPWVSDGTPEGTALVHDLIPGPQGSMPSSPHLLTPMGDRVFFAARDLEHGVELWSTDGTADGTFLVKDIFADRDTAGSNPAAFVELGDRLLFLAVDAAHGGELWTTDGTTEGTALLKDIAPGPDDAEVTALVPIGGRLIFSAADPTHGTEPWATDGTPEGTVMLRDINPGADASFPSEFTALGDRLVFQASEPEHGAELWITDGTPEGTLLLKDLIPGPDSGWSAGFTPLGERLVFWSNQELWATDGTAEHTELLDTHHACNRHGFHCDGGVGRLVELKGRLYYSAEDEHGGELWVTDGTPDGTTLFLDILPGPESSFPSNLVRRGEKLFFWANAAAGYELWVTDGTPEGTLRFRDLVGQPESWHAGNPSYFDAPAFFGGRYVFAAEDPDHGLEVWVSDGTPQGTRLLADLVPDLKPYGFTQVGSRVLFASEVYGVSISTDGTLEETVNMPFAPWPAYSVPSFLPFGDRFLYRDDNFGRTWITDGTPDGTVLFSCPPHCGETTILGPSAPSVVGLPALLGNRIVFAAEDPEHGRELWAIDVAPPPPKFHRADPNSSGTTDISDAISIFGFLFLGDPTSISCKESADSNNDGKLDISDGIYLLNWLFTGGLEPAAPGPTGSPCGVDLDPPGSAGDLGCEVYAHCP